MLLTPPPTTSARVRLLAPKLAGATRQAKAWGWSASYTCERSSSTRSCLSERSPSSRSHYEGAPLSEWQRRRVGASPAVRAGGQKMTFTHVPSSLKAHLVCALMSACVLIPSKPEGHFSLGKRRRNFGHLCQQMIVLQSHHRGAESRANSCGPNAVSRPGNTWAVEGRSWG